MALQQLMYQLFKIVVVAALLLIILLKNVNVNVTVTVTVFYILIYIQEKGIFSGLYLYLYSADLLCIWLEAYVSQSNTCTCLLTVTNILNTHLQVRDGCTRRVLHTVTSTYTVCSLYILIQIIVYANVNAKMPYKRALLQRLGR